MSKDYKGYTKPPSFWTMQLSRSVRNFKILAWPLLAITAPTIASVRWIFYQDRPAVTNKNSTPYNPPTNNSI